MVKALAARLPDRQSPISILAVLDTLPAPSRRPLPTEMFCHAD